MTDPDSDPYYDQEDFDDYWGEQDECDFLRQEESDRLEQADNYQVNDTDACPKCGERGVDELVWKTDEVVRCSTCGHRYTPVSAAV